MLQRISYSNTRTALIIDNILLVLQNRKCVTLCAISKEKKTHTTVSSEYLLLEVIEDIINNNINNKYVQNGTYLVYQTRNLRR